MILLNCFINYLMHVSLTGDVIRIILDADDADADAAA